ncbi:MAG: glycosyltransferase [Bacilli bacterium]|nr:glycosyltransferase [Bacilli bacterium]
MEINSYAKEQINQINEKCKIIKPLVVIRCLTYNHEPYIHDALESFVMQQTDFPFVAIVHDDASTDNAKNVIKEFANKYPDIILPIYERENQYSKHDGSLGRIIDTACKATGAEFIAMCEGDDYWTDPLKLQKQVNFLESHPEYYLCFHSAYIKYEKGILANKSLENSYYNLQQREYSIDEIHANFIIPTCSALFRISVLERYKYDCDYCAGDNVLWTSCASCGKIYCLLDKMSTYRINNNGWLRSHYSTRNTRILTYKNWNKHYKALRKNYPEINCKQIYLNEIKYAAIVTLTDIKPLKNVYINFRNFIKLYKTQYIVTLIKKLSSFSFAKVNRYFKNF